MTVNADLASKLQQLRIEPSATRSTWVRRRSPYALATVLLLVLAAGATGATYATKTASNFWETEKPTLQPAAKVTPTDAAKSVSVSTPPRSAVIGSGYVIAREQLVIKSQTGGKIVDLPLEVGERFAAGDVIAKIDDRQARSDLEIADAELRKAEDAIPKTESSILEAEAKKARLGKLVAGGTISKADYDATVFSLIALQKTLKIDISNRDVQKAKLEKARTSLDDYIIRAPFNGVLVTRIAQEGDVVSSALNGGAPMEGGIVEILNPDLLAVEVDVSEKNLSEVSARQKAEASLDAFPGKKFLMTLDAIIPKASSQKGTVLVRLTFDDPVSGVLPNMSVKVVFDKTMKLVEKQ